MEDFNFSSSNEMYRFREGQRLALEKAASLIESMIDANRNEYGRFANHKQDDNLQLIANEIRKIKIETEN